MSGTGRRAARGGRYAWYMLGVLALVYAFNFIDRQIPAILAEDIRRDLDVDDAQLGFLFGTAFAVFYALFGIPLGRLADGWRRVPLMALGLALWSAMTVVSGFATSFALLALARIGVGIGEASAAPTAFSMIADMFPKERRATALSVYSAGLYVGGGAALPIGGLVSSGWNAAYPGGGPLGLVGWQAAFIAVGAPGLLLALWVLSLREPERGGRAGVEPGAWRRFGVELAAILPPLTLVAAARRGRLGRNLAGLAVVGTAAAALAAATGDRAQWAAYGAGLYALFSWADGLADADPEAHRRLAASPVMLAAVVGFGSVSSVTYATGFWTAPYALRTFYDGPDGPALLLAGGVARSEIALMLGVVGSVAAATGVVFFGAVADRWRRRATAGRVYTVALSMVLHVALLWALYHTADLRLFYVLSPIAAFVSVGLVGPAVATLQDLVPERMRATASSAYVLGATMFGLALGPYAAGKIAAVSGSLRAGLLGVTAITPVTLALLWFVARRLKGAEAA